MLIRQTAEINVLICLYGYKYFCTDRSHFCSVINIFVLNIFLFQLKTKS